MTEIIYHESRLSEERDCYQVKFGASAHGNSLGNIFFEKVDDCVLKAKEDNIRQPHKGKKSRLLIKAAKKLILKKGYSEIRDFDGDLIAELNIEYERGDSE